MVLGHSGLDRRRRGEDGRLLQRWAGGRRRRRDRWRGSYVALRPVVVDVAVVGECEVRHRGKKNTLRSCLLLCVVLLRAVVGAGRLVHGGGPRESGRAERRLRRVAVLALVLFPKQDDRVLDQRPWNAKGAKSRAL